MNMDVVAFNTRDRYAGYSLASILLHWLTAIAVVVLLFTHEDDLIGFHVGLGILVTPLFLFRIGWRVSRGGPRPADQRPILNLAGELVKIAFMLCLLAVIVTGFVIPGLSGEPLDFFGIAELMIPMRRDPELAELAGEIHKIAGTAFWPLLLIHVAGALKHYLVDKDAIMRRMLQPVRGGR